MQGMPVVGMVYLAFLGFVIWVMLRIVQSLGQIATAQSAAAETMRRIADGLEKRS
jgi:hypothetical protein